MLRRGRTALELFPEPSDVHVHSADIAARVVAPDGVQKRLSRIDPVRVAHQKLHQVKFLRREVDELAVIERVARVAV